MNSMEGQSGESVTSKVNTETETYCAKDSVPSGLTHSLCSNVSPIPVKAHNHSPEPIRNDCTSRLDKSDHGPAPIRPHHCASVVPCSEMEADDGHIIVKTEPRDENSDTLPVRVHPGSIHFSITGKQSEHSQVPSKGLNNSNCEWNVDYSVDATTPGPVSGVGKFMYVDISLLHDSQPSTECDGDWENGPSRPVTGGNMDSPPRPLLSPGPVRVDGGTERRNRRKGHGIRRYIRPGERPLIHKSREQDSGIVVKMEPFSDCDTEDVVSNFNTSRDIPQAAMSAAEKLAHSIASSVSVAGTDSSEVQGDRVRVGVRPSLKPKLKPRKSRRERDEGGGGGLRAATPPRVVCSVCSATFMHQSDLKRHARIHTGERPFSCSQCPAAFHRTDHLKYHMARHTGVRPAAKLFHCESCDATFTRKNDMKRHALRKHSLGEPYPFVCGECDARFVTVSELKKHKRTHTGEKPFNCDLCDATFSQSGHLKSHMTKHTGEKPFSCERCGAAYRWSSLLKNHILKTHL